VKENTKEKDNMNVKEKEEDMKEVMKEIMKEIGIIADTTEDMIEIIVDTKEADLTVDNF
jgi:hypothetical protein